MRSVALISPGDMGQAVGALLLLGLLAVSGRRAYGRGPALEAQLA